MQIIGLFVNNYLTKIVPYSPPPKDNKKGKGNYDAKREEKSHRLNFISFFLMEFFQNPCGVTQGQIPFLQTMSCTAATARLLIIF